MIISRRKFVNSTGISAASIALSSMIHADGTGLPHFRPTAQSVIFLFMSGGPSQVDTFDPKPLLKKLEGKDVPDSIAATVPKIMRSGLKNLMSSPWRFNEYGESAIPVSELFPNVAQFVDDLCVIRSMHHRNPVHGPGECFALTGSSLGDRPSIGAWSVYGLGNANQNLPSFVSMNLHSDGMQYPQAAGWGPGFLPSIYQGTVVDVAKGIHHTTMPNGIGDAERRRQLDLIKWFNSRHNQLHGNHFELDARIQSYETAFRMQVSAPELFNLGDESATTNHLYGCDAQTTKTVGRGCLLARRMVERGVRFVQVRVGGWDAHGNIKENHTRLAARTDLPIAGLLRDLKQRGLSDSTLVIWAGEFGRTPTMEGKGNGRDHSPSGYSVWMSGGGIRGGRVIGATDPLGYVVTERPVSPHDLHATILHALGLDASRLTYQHHGRDEVPTVFGGAPVFEAFASRSTTALSDNVS